MTNPVNKEANKRLTVIKLFTVSAFEKEERWLNEMSCAGLNFVRFIPPVLYVFERSQPMDYIYRLEFLKHGTTHPETKAYLEFLRDMDVEVVGRYFKWVYLRRKRSDGPFELYGDIDSRIAHYTRIVRLWRFVFLCNLPNLVYCFFGSVANGVGFVLAMSIILVATLPLRRVIKKLKKEKILRE